MNRQIVESVRENIFKKREGIFQIENFQRSGERLAIKFEPIAGKPVLPDKRNEEETVFISEPDDLIKIIDSSNECEFDIKKGECRVKMDFSAEDTHSDFIENSLRVATQAFLARKGSLLLHASAVVIGGKAFAFCGDSDAGKTTIAEISRSAGYPVIGDDLIICDAAQPGRIKCYCSGFKGSSDKPFEYETREHSLKEVLMIEKSNETSLDKPQSFVFSIAVLIANIPFITYMPGELRNTLIDTSLTIVNHAGLRCLRFTKTGDFLKVLSNESGAN